MFDLMELALKARHALENGGVAVRHSDDNKDIK